jgi:hypothetical protein
MEDTQRWGVGHSPPNDTVLLHRRGVGRAAGHHRKCSASIYAAGYHRKRSASTAFTSARHHGRRHHRKCFASVRQSFIFHSIYCIQPRGTVGSALYSFFSWWTSRHRRKCSRATAQSIRHEYISLHCSCCSPSFTFSLAATLFVVHARHMRKSLPWYFSGTQRPMHLTKL